MAQDALARAEISVAHADNERLRSWLIHLSLIQGENSLAEALARKVRSMARRALEGEAV